MWAGQVVLERHLQLHYEHTVDMKLGHLPFQLWPTVLCISRNGRWSVFLILTGSKLGEKALIHFLFLAFPSSPGTGPALPQWHLVIVDCCRADFIGWIIVILSRNKCPDVTRINPGQWWAVVNRGWCCFTRIYPALAAVMLRTKVTSGFDEKHWSLWK